MAAKQRTSTTPRRFAARLWRCWSRPCCCCSAVQNPNPSPLYPPDSKRYANYGVSAQLGAVLDTLFDGLQRLEVTRSRGWRTRFLFCCAAHAARRTQPTGLDRPAAPQQNPTQPPSAIALQNNNHQPPSQQYRGYDSAGVCVDAPTASDKAETGPLVIKHQGKIADLRARAAEVFEANGYSRDVALNTHGGC